MTGWKKILDYGSSFELWGKGNDRRVIDRNTGRVVVEYKFKEG